tara:strand:+ start:901 stop:1149 length:249 start_codon:yes stop_codon:yes gene_type:complete
MGDPIGSYVNITGLYIFAFIDFFQYLVPDLAICNSEQQSNWMLASQRRYATNGNFVWWQFKERNNQLAMIDLFIAYFGLKFF